MNEAETRADHIDPALKAAGWGVVEGHGRPGKLLTADIVLEYRNTKLTALEELKKSLLHQAFTGEL